MARSGRAGNGAYSPEDEDAGCRERRENRARSRVSRQADQGCDGNLKRRGSVAAIGKRVSTLRGIDVAEDPNTPRRDECESERGRDRRASSYLRKRGKRVSVLTRVGILLREREDVFLEFW